MLYIIAIAFVLSLTVALAVAGSVVLDRRAKRTAAAEWREVLTGSQAGATSSKRGQCILAHDLADQRKYHEPRPPYDPGPSLAFIDRGEE